MTRAFWKGFDEGLVIAGAMSSPFMTLIALKLAIWDGAALALPLAFLWSFAGIYGAATIGRVERRRKVVRWMLEVPTVGPAQ